MSQTIQIKRRNTGASGAPASLASGELAWSAPDQTLYFGSGDNGSGIATSILKVAGPGSYLLTALLGAVNGVASLDGGGKLPASQLPASVVGAIVFQGTWNASTNSPALTSGTGTKGWYYKVSTAGATALDGTSNWNAGDLVIFNGTTWDKVDGPAEAVLTVAGRTGAVILTSADLTDATAIGRSLLSAVTVAAGRQALKIDGRTAVADAAYAHLSSDYNTQYTSITAARVITLVAASSMTPGAEIQVGDSSGSCSATNTITVTANGTDHINGGTNFVINSPYGQVTMQSDGVSKWTVVCQTTTAATTVDGGTY